MAVCLSLTASTIREDLELVRANSAWINMVELRADFLNPTERDEAASFPARLAEVAPGVETILAFRRREDGGRADCSESDRRRVLVGALEGGFSYIDLEDDVYDESPAPAILRAVETGKTRLIRSRHDFGGIPDAIVPTMLRMGRDGAVPKLAVTPADSGDLLHIFHAYEALAGAPFVLVGMGPVGVPSRVLCLAYGASWTYASAPQAVAAAPGHLSPQELIETYRVKELSHRTALFGVVGNPVGHSRSPRFHNERFRLAGRDSVYLPFQAQSFSHFLRLAEHLGVCGLSVTLPHKESAAAVATAHDPVPPGRTDPAVAATGACNTLLRSGDGWLGLNTDVPGFLAPLDRRGLPVRAAVVGAGGVARAAVYALMSRGVEVLILNRTVPRAEALADAMRDHFGSAATAGPGRGVPGRQGGHVESAALEPEVVPRLRDFSDLIVQTTSLGMSPHEAEDPLSFYDFSGSETVYDLVYTPEETTLLARAARTGCTVISGREMFDAQAELQAAEFSTYTGRC